MKNERRVSSVGTNETATNNMYKYLLNKTNYRFYSYINNYSMYFVQKKK